MKEPKKQYGVLFRVPSQDKSMAVLLCVRKEKGWDRNPLQIDDKRGNYGTLGVEQMQLVQVTRANGSVSVRDIVRVALTAQDKAPDVLKAIQDGIFFELVEKALKSVLSGEAEAERHKQATPLQALDGTDTGIMDSWLREKFEPKRDGHEIYDVDEIKGMLANIVYQQVLDSRNSAQPLQPESQEQQLTRKLEGEATARAAKERFEQFIQPMKKGDEYWFFRSDTASWLALGGRAGYVILRDKKVVASYMSQMS